MATTGQRAIAICDAIVNGTSTQAQRTRVLTAFRSSDEFMSEIRGFVLSRITSSETVAEIEEVRQAAETSVRTEFP